MDDSNNGPLLYIGNIPSRYRARDLRKFFATAVESGAFACFHFRHRPQRIAEVAAAAKVTAAARLAGVPGKRPVRLLCCYARASSDEAVEHLIRLYSGCPWKLYVSTAAPSGGRQLPLGIQCVVSRVSAAAVDIARLDCHLTGPQLAKAMKRQGLQIGAGGHPKLVELCLPACMPQGNVGTPTRHFLGLVERCQLPAGLIASLDLDLRSAGKRRGKFSAVPYDYGTAGGAVVFPATALASDESEEMFEQLDLGELPEDEVTCQASQPGKSAATTARALDDSSDDEAPCDDDEASAEAADDDDVEEPAEDWERFEALHDDPHNVERWKERKYEESLEIVWEKGGPGLVWYTDEQFWRQGEKLELFDDPTNYDWDLDMSAYEAAGDGGESNRLLGDADTRDLIDMRRLDGSFGQFERHTRAFGSALLRSYGWTGPGAPVGRGGVGGVGGGLAEPLAADEARRLPSERRTGFGYHGSRLGILGNRGGGSSASGLTRKEAALVARARATGVYLATRHDRPAVRAAIDPADSLLVRANPARLKYNSSSSKCAADTTAASSSSSSVR